MLGWLCWTEKRERAGETTLAGLPVFRAGVLRREGTPEWLLRRRIRAAGRKLARAGVRRLLWPEGFPYGELLAGEGILPVDTLPLWQGLAAELAWRELRRRGIPPGEGRAAVCAGRLTAEARPAHLTLDQLTLDVPVSSDCAKFYRVAPTSAMVRQDGTVIPAAEISAMEGEIFSDMDEW